MFSACYKSLSLSDKHCYATKLTLDSGIVLQIRNRDDVFVGGAYLVAENDGFPVAVYGAME